MRPGNPASWRILRKACRARDPGGEVRSNVFDPQKTEPARATINFRVEETLHSHNWTDGGASNADLRTVNVFDSHSAAVLVEEPHLISYTPAILQVFRLLAGVTDRVSDRAKAEMDALGERPVVLSELDLDPDTKAGVFVNSLQADSDEGNLEKLCAISSTESVRLNDLTKALGEDPVQMAQSEEAKEKRLVQLQALVEEAYSWLSDEAWDNFEALAKLKESTAQAAETALTAFAKGTIFEGVGTEVWRTLWESARRYSEAHAYSGETFPVLREGAVCVLCQQPLLKDAAGRMHSFEEFVKADVQQRANESQAELAAKVDGLQSLTLPYSVRTALIDVGLIQGHEAEAIRHYLVCAKIRRDRLLRRVKGQMTGAKPPFVPPPDLGNYSKNIREHIARLRSASQVQERREMERERAELADRIEIAQHEKTLKEEIARLRAIKELEFVLADCRTRAITFEARQAADQIISDQLRESYNRHLISLGFEEPYVELTIGAGDHGKHPFKMSLTSNPEVPPEEVLSEGERTCVALAGFLAELETTSNGSAIVLDDPVSSLDHRYRKRAAEHLVLEARKRQVIVFTHDVVFFYLLRKYGKQLSVELTEVSLDRGYHQDYGVGEGRCPLGSNGGEGQDYKNQGRFVGSTQDPKGR